MLLLQDEAEGVRRLASLVLALGSEEAENREKKQGIKPFAKTQILLQSLSVFSRQGLEQTSVQDLLEAASISRRTFYKYFSNKIDVLENIYELAVRILLTRYKEELPQAANIDELVEVLVSVGFDYAVDFGRVIAIMAQEALRADSPLAVLRVRLQAETSAILLRELQRLGANQVSELVVTSLLWAMEGALLHLMQHTECTKTDVARYKAEMRKLLSASLTTTV